MNHPTLLNVKKANKKRIKHNNMTLSNFLQNYELPHSIVLLEGKRNVKEEDKEKLTALGELLASKHKTCSSEVVMQKDLISISLMVLPKLITQGSKSSRLMPDTERKPIRHMIPLIWMNWILRQIRQ